MEQTPKSQTKTTWPTPWGNAVAVLCTIWAVRLSRTIQNTFEQLKLHSTAVALPLGLVGSNFAMTLWGSVKNVPSGLGYKALLGFGSKW